jgi:diguanylate cyclase (GGDEF)-like protein/PAS domain S-box-containing protein
MGTAGLMLVGGFCGGAAATALVLWFHDRRTRRTLEDVSRRLRRTEARTHTLLRDTDDLVAVVGADGTILYLSPSADLILGGTATAYVGAALSTVVHPDDLERVTNTVAAPPWGHDGRIEFRFRRHDGQWLLLEATIHDHRDDPALEGLVLSCRDVGERRRAVTELREAHERFRAAFDHAPIGMALISVDGRFLRANRALARMLGRAEDEVAGSSAVALTHPEDHAAIGEAARRVLAGDASVRIEQRFVHLDGLPVWAAVTLSPVRDQEGAPRCLIAQVEDLTEQRASGARLAHQAVHDLLTGLPNRERFVEQLQGALRHQEGCGRPAVLFLDLDHFQGVNDSLGHAAGDRLLVAVADRLRAAIRPTDTLARFTGDEFTVLCHAVPDEATAVVLASRVSTAVAKPVTLVEGEVYVTASVGIALATGELETAEGLLRNADAAMHHAKEQGRARAGVYDLHTHNRALQQLRTGNELHRALERHELLMHYQPILSLETGRVSGFEALLRWQHPERGLVSPNEFVPRAEETGLVVPIGVWALETSCRQAVRWHQHGASVTISVNLSPRQLAEPTLVDAIAAVLGRTGVDPAYVWLEITESTLMHDAESAVRTLTALRALGVHLSVDDFGTGYSSMTYLKRFPVDSLKVDQSFVDGLGRDAEDSAICTAVVTLAHALGLRAVAEGIETVEQLAALRTLGCEMGQGYLFGRPAPPDVWGERPDERLALSCRDTPLVSDPERGPADAPLADRPASRNPAGRVPERVART